MRFAMEAIPFADAQTAAPTRGTGDVLNNQLGKRIVWVRKGTKITVIKTRTTEYGVRPIAQELSTILRHDHKPVIFLINNGGYTIERGYLGKIETYNDIVNWSYADLPKVFRRDTQARSFVVKTVKDLQDALSAPNDTLIFVESIMGQSRTTIHTRGALRSDFFGVWITSATPPCRCVRPYLHLACSNLSHSLITTLG